MPKKPIPFFASPHFNERPANTAIDLIVLHAISLPDGQFDSQYITDLFLGNLDISVHPSFKELENTKVSSHFVIDRQGNITQFVATGSRAWHAGVSSWQGRDNCNDYAIGIEMIGDERQPFTPKQYTETARLCKSLMQHYPGIDNERIIGHQDIAPGRKWDPGKQWDWLKFHRSLSRIRIQSIAFNS